MIPGMFAQIGGREKDEIESGKVKEFVGDGTPHLKVPGLKELKALRFAGAAIPLFIAMGFPQHEDFRQKVNTEWPAVQVMIDPADDTPVLTRSMQSNDGIWQDGVKVYVTGEWEAEAKKPASKKGSEAPPDGNQQGTPSPDGNQTGATA